MPKVVYEANNTRSAEAFAKIQLKKYKIKTVFALVRKNTTWEGVGSYPLYATVISAAVELGIPVTRQDIFTVLRHDPEFKTIKLKSEIVEAMYENSGEFRIPANQARVMTKNASRTCYSADSDTLPVLLKPVQNFEGVLGGKVI